MNILVTGKSGQVGWELSRCLMPLGNVISLGRNDCDLSKPEKLPTIIQEIKPDVIVNAAAYTAVDKAEVEEDLANTINGVSVGVLAEQAKKYNALFIHYSTDYVFDGKKAGRYTEEDMPNPINAYGRSKLAGEKAIQETGVNHLILRTSWVYSVRGNNFLNTILRLTKERDELNIVADQIGTPTWARLIAETTSHCIHQSVIESRQRIFMSGIYHLTSAGETSWYDFTKEIIEITNRRMSENIITCKIKPIKTIDYPVSAERPANSRIASGKLEKHFELKMPKWEKALSLCIDDYHV